MWSETIRCPPLSSAIPPASGPLPYIQFRACTTKPHKSACQRITIGAVGGLIAEPAVGPHLAFGTISPEQWTLPNPWPPLNSVTQRRGQSLRPFLLVSSVPLVALATVTAGPWTPRVQTVMRSQAGLFCSAGFEDKRRVLASSSGFKTCPQGPLPSK